MDIQHYTELYTKFDHYKNDSEKVSPLEDDQMQLFVMATLMESQDQEGVISPDILDFFSTQILLKRIEFYKLPIKFSSSGFMAVLAITNANPGKVVAMLVELLNKYEGQTIGASHIADLYPMGFYKEEVFCHFIDDVLKARKIKWSEIY
jgi:hypothetical protein